MNWPNARNSASDLSVDGSPMITALPPPMSRPATAFLYVMPRDRRSTSLSASASDLYGHIRVPPSAGPSTVLWIAMMAFRPASLLWQKTTCSWPKVSRCSKIIDKLRCMARRGVPLVHALATAEVQAGDRCLVRHAARQAQHVVERFGLGLVRPHPGAAQRRAQHGVVDRDDGLQARVLVVAEDDLFVAEGVQVFENHRQAPLHGADPLARDAGNMWINEVGRWLAAAGRAKAVMAARHFTRPASQKPVRAGMGRESWSGAAT